MGEGFNEGVALAVLIEEVLHSIVQKKTRSNHKSTLKSAGYQEEVGIGYLLYKILTSINYDKLIIDSVVFGWQDGKRSKGVYKLLAETKK